MSTISLHQLRCPATVLKPKSLHAAADRAAPPPHAWGGAARLALRGSKDAASSVVKSHRGAYHIQLGGPAGYLNAMVTGMCVPQTCVHEFHCWWLCTMVPTYLNNQSLRFWRPYEPMISQRVSATARWAFLFSPQARLNQKRKETPALRLILAASKSALWARLCACTAQILGQAARLDAGHALSGLGPCPPKAGGPSEGSTKQVASRRNLPHGSNDNGACFCARVPC